MTSFFDAVMALLVAGTINAFIVRAIRRRLPGREGAVLSNVYMATLALRMGLALFLNAYSGQTTFADMFWGDSSTYDYGGWVMSMRWGGDVMLNRYMEGRVSGWGFFYLVGALYYLFGHNQLLVQFMNGTIGALTVLVIYAIGKHLFDVEVAQWAARFMAFFPQVVFWSGAIYKDPAVMFCIAVCMYAVLKLSVQLSPRYVVLFVAAALALMTLRFYVFYFVAFATLGTFVLAQRRGMVASVASYVTVLGVFVGAFAFAASRETLEQQKSYLSFERLQITRTDQAGRVDASGRALRPAHGARLPPLRALPVGGARHPPDAHPAGDARVVRAVASDAPRADADLPPPAAAGAAHPRLRRLPHRGLRRVPGQRGDGLPPAHAGHDVLLHLHGRGARAPAAPARAGAAPGAGRRAGLPGPMSGGRRLRLVVLALVGILPGPLKRPLYRALFGYRIARGVRIGLVLLDAERVDLGEGTAIGHLNLITRVGHLVTGRQARIGALNIIRGGQRVRLGDYAEVMRLNVLNAIPDHDCTTSPVSVLEIGDGAVVVSGHRIDFTDRVTLGRNVIVGGRNSSLWTHNRQQTAPIEIGDFCYLGSEVRLAPGARLPERSILGLGSVLTGAIDTPGSLVGGMPARVLRPLTEEDEVLVRRKARPDAPDDLYAARARPEG